MQRGALRARQERLIKGPPAGIPAGGFLYNENPAIVAGFREG